MQAYYVFGNLIWPPDFDNQNFSVESYHGIALTGVIHIYMSYDKSQHWRKVSSLSHICTLKLKNVSKAQKDKLCVGKRVNSQAGSKLVKNTRKKLGAQKLELVLWWVKFLDPSIFCKFLAWG